MIDPMETVIAHALRDADLRAVVADRIAAAHKYGNGWTPPADAGATPCEALTIRLDGGPVDLYTTTQMPRLEFSAWGRTKYDCTQVYKAVVALSRNTRRVVVPTTDGNALLYYLVLVSAPTFSRDLDVDAERLMWFMQAMVAEQDVL